MQIWVETEMGYGGVEVPRRFRLDGREVEVIENVDQWHGADHRYFKVRGHDGGTYILRLNEDLAEWELTMYQRAHSEDACSSANAIRRAGHNVRM
jgi:hypothetical protein